MAISTYGVTLKSGASSAALTKLCDVKTTPALGGEPELLETTTMSDSQQTYIPGIQSMEAMTFTTNYDLATYKSIKQSENTEQYYALEFGESGSEGTFEWQGQHVVYVNEGEVNAVVEMTIVVVPSTVITLKASE